MILASSGILPFSIMDAVDILVVCLILYFLITKMWNTSAMYILVSILILVLVRVVAGAANMRMLSAIMGALLDVGTVAIIVIFQPEIRRFLGRLGRNIGTRYNFLNKILSRKDEAWQQDDLNELCDACANMSSQKTGALIVVLHKDPLTDIVGRGDTIDADIRSRLIENIFFKNSPLHDGAMIINGRRIQAVRCTLPITERTDIPARYGMRHKAAIGLSEAYDADVIVVSEQTGKISFVRGGEIVPVSGKNHLKLILSEEKEEK